MLGGTYLDGLAMALDGLEKIVDRPLVNEDDMTDLAARMNAAFNRFESVNKKAKEKIKAELLMQNKTIWQGKNFEACLQRIEVSRLMTDKVKKFLGKKLSDYLDTSVEFRLLFKPRS